MQYEHRNAINGNNNDSGVHPLSFSAKKSVCTRIDRIKHTIYVEKRVCFIRIVNLLLSLSIVLVSYSV